MTAADRELLLRRGCSLACWTALALLGAYVATQRGRIASYDGSIMAHLAHRILFDHALTIDPRDDLMGLQHPYASYGIGTTLLLLPFVWLQSLFAPGRQTWITLTNPLVLAACGALVTRLGLELQWRPYVAFLSGLGFGLLTPALWQSTELMADPGVAFGLLLSVFGILTMPRAAVSGSLWLSLGGALCLLFRLDSLVLILPFLALAFAVQGRRVRASPPSLVVALIPVGSALLFQAWYNAHRYGSVLEAGYASQARGRGFSTPIADGLSLLLLSPGKGFFWYSPILLLALPGAILLYRRDRALTLILGGLCVVRFLFFAKWWTPWGGVSWGPRLLFPITGLMALAAGEAVEQMRVWSSPLRRRLAAAAVAVLALVSASISITSVAIPYEKFWHANVDAAPPSIRLQRRHDYLWTVEDGPMAGNLRLLKANAPTAFLHFADGPSLVGSLALALFVVAVAAGTRTAIRRRPTPASAEGPRPSAPPPPDGTPGTAPVR